MFDQIKLLALDFDGVMTDGKVIVCSTGTESVVCSHLDGQGIADIKRHGIEVIVVSAQTSPYVRHRCQKMGIPCFAPVTDKKAEVSAYIRKRGMTWNEICFMGDDRGDLEVMSSVSWPVAVANAIPEIKQVAKYVTVRSGGDGAIREVCDLILSRSG